MLKFETKSPGMLFVNIWGRKVITISTKQQTIEIPKSLLHYEHE